MSGEAQRAAQRSGAAGDDAAVLRARIADLEVERAELLRRTNEAIAAAEEKTYWLDRWNLDLNALMRKPGAAAFRSTIRAYRRASARLRGLRRRLAS